MADEDDPHAALVARQARADKKTHARRAAEEDARGMLLAAGYAPDDQAAIDALLAPSAGPGRRAYTITEWCLMYGFSRTRFNRARKRNETPAVTVMLGQQRITQASIDEWEKKRAKVVEPLVLPEPRQARAKRANRVVAAQGDEQRLLRAV